jgi:acetoin:2,6-dichlorophenolindophenol oxidoreductase subunit alpha
MCAGVESGRPMSLAKLQLCEIYRRMLRIRRFGEEDTRLYIAGKIPWGAFHASIGQEATIVGACMALRDQDFMTGTHRSHGHPYREGRQVERP